MVPRVTDERLSNARRLRKEMTTAGRDLRNRGIPAEFRRQVPIGPYVADFASVGARSSNAMDSHMTTRSDGFTIDIETLGFLSGAGAF